MAEIIRPDFGRKKTEGSEPARKPEQPKVESDVEDTEATRTTLVQDLKFLLTNEETAQQANRRIDEITEYIFSLANFNKNDRNIDIRRQGLKSATLEDLAGHLCNSNEMDWKTKPSFYGAVILEYDQRMKQIRATLPKERE